MTIILKNKETLIYEEFCFKCCIGKNGLTKNKFEGDKKTPKGTYFLDHLFYRKDKNQKPKTKLKCIPISKNMGWCNDTKVKKKYNKLIKINKRLVMKKCSGMIINMILLFQLNITQIKQNWEKEALYLFI